MRSLKLEKTTAESLRFNKRTKKFATGGKFTTADILAGVQGTKTDYTVKNITTISPNIVTFSSSAKTLNFNSRAGSFNATIILEHPTKLDATIQKCAFEIRKATAESLRFNKITKKLATGGKFTTTEILGGVQGNKTDYTVKNITLTTNNLVTVSASKELNFRGRIGSFTATIVLEHPAKLDATITDAQFEITKGNAESLTFNKKTKKFATGGSFTTADILGGVQGNKTDYTVKNITLTTNNLVTVSASKELNFSGRIGSFTATIVLEHPAKLDATITGAEFEITKGNAESLTFQKVYKEFANNGSFTTADILAGVQGTKYGYTVKNITTISPDIVTFSSSTKTLNFSGGLGSFTATIVLEHSAKLDATINGGRVSNIFR